MTHDRELFDALMAELRLGEPELRAGVMFGCPAGYLGRHLAFCVHGDAVGAKLPESRAADLIATAAATRFRPFNRPAMAGWVELRVAPGQAAELAPLLREAIDHARARP